MAEKKIAPDIARLSFEDALKELEQIVRRLETGETTLDQAIDDYARGSQLKTHCEKKLQDARLKVEKIMSQPAGSGVSEVSTVPFEA